MTGLVMHASSVLTHRPDPSVRPVELATAAVLTLLAIVVRWAPSRARRGERLQDAAMVSVKWVTNARRPTPRQTLGAAFAGCAVGLFIGGPGGVLAGAMTGIGVLVFGSRRVSENETRARQRLIAAAPPVVDLFAAALASGLLPLDAATVVATAFHDGPTLGGDAVSASGAESVAEAESGYRADAASNGAGAAEADPVREIAARFAAAARALREGVEPETAWRLLSVDGATAPVAAAALRASRTGAPASETVAKAARDTWNAAEQAAQAQIRAVAVRATAPLALCFLPAFVLVGIVPTALGLLTELHS